MTEKEFRKLRSLDLIHILLTQSAEENKLQGILDNKKEHLALLKEEQETLIAKLNDRDALLDLLKQKLNQSDVDIRELKNETDILYTDQRINIEEIGSLTEAVQKVNMIIEAAQKNAEKYLMETKKRIKE